MRRVGMVLGVILLVALVAAQYVALRRTTVQVDAISGEVRKSHLWVGRGRSASVESSALANRLRSLGIAWAPDWRTINVNEYNIFGGATSRGCSSAPPIYQLGPFQAAYASDSSPEELREFVAAMQGASDREQRELVERAADKGFDAAAAVK